MYITQTISSCVPFSLSIPLYMQVLLSMCLWSYTIHAVLTKSCELIVVCAANIVDESSLRTRRSPIKTSGGCFK